jgi:hypothetical protein
MIPLYLELVSRAPRIRFDIKKIPVFLLDKVNRVAISSPTKGKVFITPGFSFI